MFDLFFFELCLLSTLKILAMDKAKTAKISNFRTIWPVRMGPIIGVDVPYGGHGWPRRFSFET